MEPTRVERKLTAILSADVKGYSRLMGEDEVATIRTLTAYRELIISLIQKNRGRVVDTPGDNLLAEFSSVVDAVSCAVEMQREIAQRNVELPDQRKMEFRIGINLGDVVVEGERIYGDGVNIAARLESLAEGGGICISGAVFDSIGNRLKLEYDYMGEQTVKNITQPVRVYRVLVPGSAAHRVIHAQRAVRSIPAYTEAATIGSHSLVGRQEELSFLQQRLDAISQGKGSVVFITGKAGIGKTRLAREVREFAQQKGCQWLEGKYERAVSYPYKAWADVVKSYLYQDEGRSWQSLAGTYSVHLAKIVPEIAEELKDTSAVGGGDPENERLRLFEGLTQFFIHVSHEAPLVLFLDDLQWASSIELVHYLSRSIGNQRILTLATYRDDDLKENASLWRTILAMNRERLFHSLPLKALDEGDVGRLLSGTVEGPVAPQLLERIYHRTEGNPFFVEEVVRFLREREAIVRTEAGWDVRESSSLKTPDSVKVVITERLEQLGQDAEEALCMASVIGREFPLHLLEELVNQGGEELLGVIDRCERAGLIVSKPVPGEEVFSFTHDLMHEALYEGIGSVHRRRHHLKIGQAMEKLYGTRLEDRYDVLAHHFFEGNDLKKAVEYGELAARRAIGVHSFSNAVRLLEKVLEAQAVVDPNDRAKRCDLLFTLGSALGPAGESQRVADMVAPEALKLAEALDDRHRASQCCQMALDGMWRYGGPPITRSPAWRQWAEWADRYAASGTIERVYADLALSLVRFGERRWVESRTLLVRAGELARELDEPEALFRAMTELIKPQGSIQHQAERLRLVEEFMGVPRERVTVPTLGNFLLFSQMNFFAAGERGRAEEQWHELEQLASRTQDATLLLWPLAAEAIRATLDGDVEAVVVAGRRIIDRADELGTPVAGRLWAEHLLFRPLLYLGRGEEALATLPQAERLAGARVFSSVVRFGWSALCLAHMGGSAEAHTQLSENIRQMSISTEEDETPAVILATLLDTAVLVKDRGVAALLAQRLAGVVAMAASYLTLANVARNLGGAAALLGDRAAARGHYERALDWATKIRFRPEVALTRFELADLLLSEAKDASADQAVTLRSEAQAHLDFAIGEFQAMKMQPALERALHHKREGQS